MTITDIRPEIDPATETTDLPTLPAEMYAVPENPWKPWMFRAGGTALGVCLVAGVTTVLHPALMGWAAGTAIAFALLFAWVLGGYEQFENNA